MIKSKDPLFWLLLLPLVLLGANSYSQGDLMVMPKRIVFDGSQRSQEINLINTGNEPAVYAISFVNYMMTEDGSFEQVEEPEEGQRFATDFLRYFPRQVRLAPGEAQTVRLQLLRTGNLENGEYRSHVYFRAVEEQTALGSQDAQESEGISINIKTVFGISIPVIIRNGNSTTELSLSDISLDKETKTLSIVLNRSGNMSVYGNISVVHTAPGGKETEVGLVKGVSVYTPNAKRNFSFQLNSEEEVDLSKGSLEITYTEEAGRVLAKTSFTID